MSSASVEFRVNQGGVDRLLHDTGGPYGQWLTRVGNRAVNESKIRANVDTGLMRSRIEFRLVVEGGTLVGYVEAKTEYAIYVHAYNPFLLDGVAAALSAGG